MFKITVKTLGGSVTAQRKAKFETARLLAENIVNSEEFKAWFVKQLEDKKFTQLSDEQRKAIPFDLLQKLLREAKLDYYIQRKPWWKRFTSVIGWSIGDDIVTYADHFDGMSIPGLAAHLVHEVSHFLGFSHSFDYMPARDFSIPYSIGTKAEQMAREMTRVKLAF